LIDSGLPYPGHAVGKVRDDAFYMTTIPVHNIISLLPPAQGSNCYIYYDESTIGFCELFSGGRPGNTWFDGSYDGQTCEERADWWSGQLWHQCLIDSGLPYPGHAAGKVRDDAFYMTTTGDSMGSSSDRRRLQEATQLRHTTSLQKNARSLTMKI